MSILQDYEKFRKEIGNVCYEHIEAFLECHKHYLLSDVYYMEGAWKEFEEWEKENYKDYVVSKPKADFPDCIF